MRYRAILPIVAVAALAGCSVQRAQTASAARSQMIGMAKENVLACMGPPQQRAAEGATEVWSYGSGGRTVGFAGSTTQSTGSGVAMGSGTAIAGNGTATGSATVNSAYAGQSSSFGSFSSQNRYCVVNLTMTEGRVSAVNYVGNTGGLISQGSECAYAVQNCVH